MEITVKKWRWNNFKYRCWPITKTEFINSNWFIELISVNIKMQFISLEDFESIIKNNTFETHWLKQCWPIISPEINMHNFEIFATHVWEQIRTCTLFNTATFSYYHPTFLPSTAQIHLSWPLMTPRTNRMIVPLHLRLTLIIFYAKAQIYVTQSKWTHNLIFWLC